jgi:hypothetical protein
VAVAAGAAAVPACGRTDLDPPFPLPAGAAIMLSPVFDQTVNSDLDIVFVVDNSGSMKEEQASLARNFPAFMDVLEALPEGVPNLHIGVVSSDLGAGPFIGVESCMKRGGDGGVFQATPRAQNGTCTSAPHGQSYISAVAGQQNFTGSISDALACIAELGTSGCGFEHQLGAARRALGGDPQGLPAENAGFLRDEALLAIVIITDEDDCSAPDDTDLFDPSQIHVSDPLGPLTSYRCNEFGHLCAGVPPPRTMAADNLADCHSNETASGKLTHVGDFVTFFRSLKPDPDDVIVAAITGPATPYSVGLQSFVYQQQGFSQKEPRILPSCESANGTAAPAVRLKDFTDAFGANGTLDSICNADFSPALSHIAETIAGRIRHQCLSGPPVDSDPGTPGVQPTCEVYQETATSSGAAIRTSIDSCDRAAPPCWRMRSAPSCPTGAEIVVDRGSIAPPPHTHISVLCATCSDAEDPRCAS